MGCYFLGDNKIYVFFKKMKRFSIYVSIICMNVLGIKFNFLFKIYLGLYFLIKGKWIFKDYFLIKILFVVL